MSDSTGQDSVSMEFVGPVPGILGQTTGFHVVYWVHAAGGARFTRPSSEEREYYVQMGRAVPEWQCDYFDFDGLSWTEAALTIELWHGTGKLRSLCAGRCTARTEADLRAELPELARFIEKNGLDRFDVKLAFRDALLRAAESAGVIARSASPGGNSAESSEGMKDLLGVSWWRKAWRATSLWRGTA